MRMDSNDAGHFSVLTSSGHNLSFTVHSRSLAAPSKNATSMRLVKAFSNASRTQDYMAAIEELDRIDGSLVLRAPM